MKVLGIDPGYERLGIAVVSRSAHGEALEYSECFRTAATQEHGDRLGCISRHLDEVIARFEPTALAIETLFFNTNQKTAIKVAEARGAVLARASLHNLSIFEYAPGVIKNAITGYGKSSKRQVMDMVPRLVRIEKDIRYDDEYDAIAAALTCSAIEGRRHAST